MRGKLGLRLVGCVCIRNIPAYAGKTVKRGRGPKGPWEHPRVCGENDYIRHKTHLGAGTSPRMRGKLEVKVENSQDDRNIPAYAGKTTP